QNSVVSSFTASGGGYGGNNNEPNGGNGGSGGGQGRDGCGTAGTGTVGQGNNGGDTGCGGWNAGGGGGGAGEAGYYGGNDYNGVSGTASKGGDGVASSITGTLTYYAGGGGGGHNGGNTAQDGLGGGGNGTDSIGQNGQANTGGGGGGGRNGAGGTGGSGVVVLAYPNTYPDLAVSSLLTYTQPTRAGYKVYKFTSGSGAIAFQNQTAAPSASASVTGVAGNEQVSLSWTAAFSAGPSISDYLIEYSSDSGTNWTAFSHSASTVTTATITGLTNDTAYLFRVAAVNSVGTGSYTTSSSITPNLFMITTQPKNDYATAMTQNVTYSVGVVGGGTPTYQWQYFGPNFDAEDYEYRWRNISGASSSSYVTNGNTISNLILYDFYYTAAVKLRCVVTAEGGAPALTSDAVKFLELDYMHYPSVYWYGNQGGYVNYETTQTFSPSAGENLVLDLYDYAMGYSDTSWYTGNDTTVKVQVATTGYTDSADWTDLYTADFRGNFYLPGYQIPPDTGTKYYRVIAVNKWPYTVNNGTQSATHATQYIYPHYNYNVVRVTWP
ncbi:MAG: fibronectin type III domain-containing protein, partial [bacterium]